MTDVNPTEGMALSEWLEFMRINKASFARMLGVTRQVVYTWEQRGYIPAKYREQIETTWINRTPDTLFTTAEAA